MLKVEQYPILAVTAPHPTPVQDGDGNRAMVYSIERAFHEPVNVVCVFYGNLLNVAHLFRAIHWCKLEICASYSYL